MKKQFVATTALLLAQLIAGVTFASSVSQAEPKQQLALTPGTYTVNAKTAIGTDPFCAGDSSYDVAWAGNDQEPVLSLGETVMFLDFNRGLIPDGEDENSCKLKSSTQTEKGLVRTDTFTECAKASGNKTVTKSLKISEKTIEYKNETKVSRAGKKVLVFSSSCTLELKAKKK
ncbi:MAG: hypothetical protein EOP06_12200 [Proteobacteria bacterium]|nr:MAG: hypothetical protein EOP06_12200 [Pseudomonadota bacterium]